jgi:hypothetical protein
MTTAVQSIPFALQARWAERAHYLDLIQIYTGLGDEDLDVVLMGLPRTKEPAAQDDRISSTPTDEGVKRHAHLPRR